MTKSVEKLQTAANGRENVADGDVVSRLAFVYAWDDPAFELNKTQKGFFRLSVNIAHDLGISGALNANIIKALERLGAVRSVGDNGKPSGKVQNNPDNPTGITARGQGFFVPPRVQHSEAGDAGDTVSDVPAVVDETTATAAPEAASKPKRKRERKGIGLKDTADSAPNELALVDLGEDGQPLVREVGEFAGGSVAIELNFGAAVETAGATTSAPETPKAVEYPEFGSVEYNRMVGVVVGSAANLAGSVMPEHLVGYSSALAEASAKVRRLGAPETLVAAVSYAGIGLRVFPLAENAKVPEKGSHGFRDASTDTGQLIQWFDDGEFFQKGGNPRRNLGIATGETDAGYDLVALDVDVKNGKNGFLVFGWAVGEFGELPATLMASTPSGGLHYLFKAPMGSNIGSRAGVFKQHGEGLDIRGRGGMVIAAPTTVDGKSYRWLNDSLPAWLPDSWIAALEAECPAGGKRGAVSSSSNVDGERVTRGELLPVPEDVAAALAEHAVPSSVKRKEGWLQVLSVLSGFVGGEALAREWSRSGGTYNDADFDKAWDEVHGGFNGGVPMAKGKLFNLVKEHSPEWQTPEQRRKLEQKAKEAGQTEAARDGAFGVMPDWIKDSLSQRTNVSMPIAAVSDDRARVVLNDFVAKGNEVAKRVQAGENVGHDAEYLFIVGMLTMNAEAVKYQVEHNPIPEGRSSKYHTKMGKVRAVIMHSDGSKPATAGDVNMGSFVPDWVKGTYELAMRIANRLMLDRDVAQGVKPTETEKALVKRVIELSPLGLWFLERKQGGDNLTSAVEGGLSRATRYSTNTPQPNGKSSGSGLITGELPKTGGRLSWIDKELTHHGGAVGELDDMSTSDQIESLLGVYGCRAVFDEMHWKPTVHGLPKRFVKLDHAVTAIREMAKRHGTEWRKADVTDSLKLLATGTRYHPALEWVRSIPWDGQDRFGALLDTVTVAEDYRDFWPIALHRFSMGAVRCLAQPGGMKGVPAIVFYEPLGGSGKDMWQSALCPEEFTTTPEGFKPGNINWKLAALDGWICVMPEITTASTKHSVEEVKAYLTASKHSYPDKYEMDVNQRPVRTVNIASTNQQDFLADRSGNNRRFSPIQVRKVNYRHGINMQQYWAQMLHNFEAAWESGDEETHQFWFTERESAIQKEITALHVVSDSLEHDIKALWDFDNEEWIADKHSLRWAVPTQTVKRSIDPDRLQEIGVKPQVFEIRLARELGRLGVDKVRHREPGVKNSTAHYLMPPRKQMTPPGLR